ncbi:hypothetical protein L1S34_12275 [Flavobacterium sp. K77]|uniref:hypothetical protein n=1 Tax=Flavobacterium sp. K77 TaxID=2910676 RepID=UPI001F29AD06|nr:hypothetical protein [Flavobacterium sp. K77]MCF6142065.1 hypothetical protein [Flavobacterium sp. K77]
MKYKLFITLFLISVSLILLNRFSDLSINSPLIYWLMIFVLYSTFFLLLNGILKEKYRKATKILIIIIGVICIGLYRITYLSFWGTQTIEYVNISDENKSIEFQMRDLGALGFKTRIIEKTKILPNINWIKEIDTSKINKTEWKKVEIERNEMNLKFP